MHTNNKQFALCLIFISCFCLALPCLAQGSGFYENTSTGRPRSVFSICCCKKDTAGSNDSLSFYKCEYIEETSCSENTQQYKNGFDCPSTLILKKYKQTTNVNKEEQQEIIE